MFCQLIFLEFLLPPPHLPNFCLSEEKKNPGDNILKSYLFPIVFVLRLLYFTLYIFQLIPFCSLFTYFKIKNWGNFSYLFRSIISLKVLLSNKSLSFNCEILPIFDWESWKFLFLLYMHLGDLMNSTNGFYMQWFFNNWFLRKIEPFPHVIYRHIF